MTDTSATITANIDIVVKKIAAAKHPVSFSGAGLSAESGIATFRDKNEDALWSQFDPMQLASQEGFKANPARVIDWYNWRRQTARDAKPNAAHKALGSQSNWTHITQNVDQLLEQAGATTDRVLHLHGTIGDDHCNADCGYVETADFENLPGLRNCPNCGEYMRPAVVWFGESLPQAVFEAAISATQRADLFLVVGTSATVVPASGLIDLARDGGADIVIVNTEKSSALAENDIQLIGNAGNLIPKLFNLS